MFHSYILQSFYYAPLLLQACQWVVLTSTSSSIHSQKCCPATYLPQMMGWSHLEPSAETKVLFPTLSTPFLKCPTDVVLWYFVTNTSSFTLSTAFMTLQMMIISSFYLTFSKQHQSILKSHFVRQFDPLDHFSAQTQPHRCRTAHSSYDIRLPKSKVEAFCS